jgi:hypothetical protein
MPNKQKILCWTPDHNKIKCKNICDFIKVRFFGIKPKNLNTYQLTSYYKDPRYDYLNPDSLKNIPNNSIIVLQSDYVYTINDNDNIDTTICVNKLCSSESYLAFNNKNFTKKCNTNLQIINIDKTPIINSNTNDILAPIFNDIQYNIYKNPSVCKKLKIHIIGSSIIPEDTTLDFKYDFVFLNTNPISNGLNLVKQNVTIKLTKNTKINIKFCIPCVDISNLPIASYFNYFSITDYVTREDILPNQYNITINIKN